MLHSLRNELRRGLCSPYPYMGLAVCILIYAISFTSLDWINVIRFSNGSVVHQHNQFLLEYNPCRILLPLAATLPFCASVAEDWEHHLYYFITTRCRFNAFCAGKFVTAGVFGGTVLMLGLWFFLIFLRCFIPLCTEGAYYEPFIEPLLLNNQFGLYLLYFGSLQFILGFLCAGIGCVVSVLTSRRAMIYLTPLLLFAMLEIITTITIVGLSGGQSALVFRLKDQSLLNVYGFIFGFLSSLTCASYVLFCILLRWRIYRWQ